MTANQPSPIANLARVTLAGLLVGATVYGARTLRQELQHERVFETVEHKATVARPHPDSVRVSIEYLSGYPEIAVCSYHAQKKEDPRVISITNNGRVVREVSPDRRSFFLAECAQYLPK